MKTTYVILAAVLSVAAISAPGFAQDAMPGKPGMGFVTQQNSDRLASRLIGLNIKNPADETTARSTTLF